MQNRKMPLVKGARSGIGRSVAAGLLCASYVVALAGRRLEPLRETVVLAWADDKSAAERALTMSADVIDPASVKDLFARTQARFGRLDLPFNNAGIFVAPVSL